MWLDNFDTSLTEYQTQQNQETIFFWAFNWLIGWLTLFQAEIVDKNTDFITETIKCID